MDIGAELSGSEGRGRKGGEVTVMASFQPASKRDAWANKSRGEVRLQYIVASRRKHL
jgi:hypothetical protein